MSAVVPRVYRPAGGAMLRAAVLPCDRVPVSWPDLSDRGSCRSWLGVVWTLPGFAEACRHASVSLASRVEGILAGEVTSARIIRRVTVSTLRYLLRAVGRSTPFGLFAGVAPATVGDGVDVVWGGARRFLIRADTLWLDAVVEGLEASLELLSRLRVVVSDLVVDRGGRVEIPRGPGLVSVRNTAAVRLAREAARAPIGVSELAATIGAAFPGVPRSTIVTMIGSLVAHGVLISELRSPMTETDPLGQLIRRLGCVLDEGVGERVSTMVTDLRAIQRAVGQHNDPATDAPDRARLRTRITERMRRVVPGGRAALAGDLCLGCRVRVPNEVAEEMAHAVDALIRLTRQPRPDPVWNDWCRDFWDRYGPGALVPVAEATHPDSGIGLPAGFPGSPRRPPADRVLGRDQALLRLAWEAVAEGRREIVLGDEQIATITAEDPIDPRLVPPHAELGARVRATSQRALAEGDFTLLVRPAWGLGTLTSRFASTVVDGGLEDVLAATPPSRDGALSAQLAFPPLFPHSENVARIPAYLSHVLSLGEYRAERVNVIRLDDVGIVALANGLHLMSLSQRRVIDPQVFHALALDRQAPPLARFLARMTRGFLARLTEFEWGPPMDRLPFLPRVRHRRAVLSPARWRLSAADRSDLIAQTGTWPAAIARWRRRWDCPRLVELHDEHRWLRLDLAVEAHLTLLGDHLDSHGHATLAETETDSELGWLDGHVHEIVMPFTRDGQPAPNPVAGLRPVATGSAGAHLPASPQSRWLYAQIFTHPDRIDDLLRTHLPGLLADLDDQPYWFARYRGERETDHLRLRVRAPDVRDHASTALAIGRWGQHLVDLGAASGLTFATYRPENGRYGEGPAMEAAEDVFATDSHAVALALRLVPEAVIQPTALTALGMVDIVDAFHPDPASAVGWLLDNLDHGPGVSADRAVARQAVAWSWWGAPQDGRSLPAEVNAAWAARRDAVAHYRRALSDTMDIDRVLHALLHMHHNRSRLIDRDDEAVCLRLARKIALARRALTVRGDR